MIAIVKYQIGTYHGTINVSCDENDDDEIIIARAKSKLRNLTSMSMYYEHYEIISRN